jgi:hypothetical protein
MSRYEPATACPGRPTVIRHAQIAVFLLLAAALLARPLIPETLERAELSFLPAAAGPTPATTAWLDAITLGLAGAALALTCRPLHAFGWAGIGLALLTIGGAVSVAVAGDRRLALNATANLLILALAGLVLTRLLQADWMRRLLLAAALATGCATGVKCLIWRTNEWQVTRDYWQEYKSRLSRSGADLSSPLVENFERRLQSGEAMGYQWHPNITGSYLAMWLLAGTGLLAAWGAARVPQSAGERFAGILLSAAICATVLAGLLLTASLGAMIAFGAGLVLFAATAASRRWPIVRPDRLLAAFVAGYLVLVAGGVIWGLACGTLPHPSLAFRWHYWQAAARALRDAPLTGIGRLNFTDAYLLHKPPESPEDVRDPHNLWLTLLVELGPLGLIGAGVLVGGALRGAFRQAFVVGARQEMPELRAQLSRGPLYTLFLTPGLVLLIQALFSRQLVDVPTAVVWAVELAAVWVISFFCAERLLERLARAGEVDGLRAAAIFSALAGALVHGLVDFAPLTPGGIATFAGLAAAAAPIGTHRPSFGPGRAVALAACTAALLAFQIAQVAVPTARAEQTLDNLRCLATQTATTQSCQPLLAAVGRARQAGALDASGARQAAGLLRELVGASGQVLPCEKELLEEARELGELALRLNPRSAAAYVGLAKTWDRIEELWLLSDEQAAAAALRRSAGYWEQAARLQPADPRTRIAAGRAWFRWWKESKDESAAHVAVDHLLAALRIDSARPPQELMRLRPAELEELYNLLRRLESTDRRLTTMPGAGP